MKDGDIGVFICKDIGTAGITDVHMRENQDGTFTARMGIALMGSVNNDKSYGANPFDETFHDNFCEGTAKTKEEAVEKMVEDKKSICDSIWAV